MRSFVFVSLMLALTVVLAFNAAFIQPVSAAGASLKRSSLSLQPQRMESSVSISLESDPLHQLVEADVIPPRSAAGSAQSKVGLRRSSKLKSHSDSATHNLLSPDSLDHVAPVSLLSSNAEVEATGEAAVGAVNGADALNYFRNLPNAAHKTPTLVKTVVTAFNDNTLASAWKSFHVPNPNPLTVGVTPTVTIASLQWNQVTLVHLGLFMTDRINADQLAIAAPGKGSPANYQIVAEIDPTKYLPGVPPPAPSFRYRIGAHGEITRVRGFAAKGYKTDVKQGAKNMVKTLFNLGSNQSNLGTNIPDQVDNGHIIAASLGGSNSDIRNFFPQDKQQNNALLYKQAEDAVYNQLYAALAPNCVSIEISFVYTNGNYFIPTSGTYRGYYNNRVQCFGNSPNNDGADHWTSITTTVFPNPLLGQSIVLANVPASLHVGQVSGPISLTPNRQTFQALNVAVTGVDQGAHAVTVSAPAIAWIAGQTTVKTFTVTAPLAVGTITVSYAKTLNAGGGDLQFNAIPNSVIQVVAAPLTLGNVPIVPLTPNQPSQPITITPTFTVATDLTVTITAVQGHTPVTVTAVVGGGNVLRWIAGQNTALGFTVGPTGTVAPITVTYVIGGTNQPQYAHIPPTTINMH